MLDSTTNPPVPRFTASPDASHQHGLAFYYADGDDGRLHNLWFSSIDEVIRFTNAAELVGARYGFKS